MYGPPRSETFRARTRHSSTERSTDKTKGMARWGVGNGGAAFSATCRQRNDAGVAEGVGAHGPAATGAWERAQGWLAESARPGRTRRWAGLGDAREGAHHVHDAVLQCAVSLLTVTRYGWIAVECGTVLVLRATVALLPAAPISTYQILHLRGARAGASAEALFTKAAPQASQQRVANVTTNVHTYRAARARPPLPPASEAEKNKGGRRRGAVMIRTCQYNTRDRPSQILFRPAPFAAPRISDISAAFNSEPFGRAPCSARTALAAH
ncbi:hypothetical protein FGB62_1g526 [Gracilaria domingensis]|nr:hypothetical protein FGB62_1g526 [Gracilaria domingensis]